MSETSVSFRDSQQRDALPVLIQILYVVAPLEILMVYAGTTELTAGMVMGGALGAVGLALLASSRLTLSWHEDRPIAYMLLFLCVGALSTSQTIYGMPAIQKGVVNLAAMLAMVLMVMVVKQTFIQWPRLFLHVVRITAITTGLAGLTAIFQSFVSNVLGQPQLFNLSFINDFWGTDWWRYARLGVVRAQGIYGEPSFLAAFIGMAAGLAMARLGLIGTTWRREIRSVVPQWAAASILLSLILSFSAVVYAGLLAAYLGSLASKTTFTVRSILILAIGSVVALAVLAVVAIQAGDVIASRVTGMAVLAQLNDVDSTDRLGGDVNFSVQIVFVNAYVTLENLLANPWLGAGVGAHPYAYAALLPAFPALSRGAAGLNAMDASALILRLLSETGVLGTLMFTAAILSASLRARKVVLARDTAAEQSLKAIAIGLNGSLAGVFVAMLLHIPHYYAAEFWALFALCVAVPAMSSNALSRSPASESVRNYAQGAAAAE